MADETRQIQVLLGPYRDNRLTVSAADADAAINAHWAVDPHHVAEPDEEPHPPLTEEERTAAFEAATTWAQAQWDAAQQIGNPKEPPAEGTAVRRDMKPDETAGRYATREADHDKTPDDAHSTDHPRRRR